MVIQSTWQGNLRTLTVSFPENGVGKSNRKITVKHSPLKIVVKSTQKYINTHFLIAMPTISGFPFFHSSFPVRSCVAKRKQKDRHTLTCTIEASETDLSSPPTKIAKKLGHDIVTLLSPICENATGMPLSKVLALTPNSGIAERKNRAQQKDERRKRMRNVKEKVELEFHKHDSILVLQKRLSFRKYNKISHLRV